MRLVLLIGVGVLVVVRAQVPDSVRQQWPPGCDFSRAISQEQRIQLERGLKDPKFPDCYLCPFVEGDACKTFQDSEERKLRIAQGLEKRTPDAFDKVEKLWNGFWTTAAVFTLLVVAPVFVYEQWKERKKVLDGGEGGRPARHSDDREVASIPAHGSAGYLRSLRRSPMMPHVAEHPNVQHAQGFFTTLLDKIVWAIGWQVALLILGALAALLGVRENILRRFIEMLK